MNRRLEPLLAHPSAMLLASQLIQVLAWPFLEGSIVGRSVLGVIGMLAVGSAVSRCGARRW